MNPEHELRILEVDPQAIGEKILKLGGNLVLRRTLQKRYTYNTIPAERNKWVRLRTNGVKTTLAIKHVTGEGVSDTKELEVEVSDFGMATALMTELGIQAKSYQENYRTLYELKGAEIMVDEWPLIPPYIEVEASSPELVDEIITKLGFSPKQATGLDVSSVYEQIYHIDIDEMPELKFDTQAKKLPATS
jgi:adenylate cyclase class 2